MKLSEQRCQFTKNLAKLITFINFNLPGYSAAIDSAKRTILEQTMLVQSGASKTMNSAHLEGLAADVLLYIDGVYQRQTESYKILGDYWKEIDSNNVWGGDFEGFPDGNHFEYLKE